MKKLKKSIYFIFAILLTLMVFSSSCTKKEETKSEDYVNFKVGNQWTYVAETKPKKKDYEIKASEKAEKSEKSEEPSDDEKTVKEDAKNDSPVNDDKKVPEGESKKGSEASPEKEPLQEARNEFSFKITGTEDVDGVKCFIRETLTNQASNPQEFYQVDPEKGVYLMKQKFFVLNPNKAELQLVETRVDPPQLMIEFPLKEGKSWTKSTQQGNVTRTAVFLVRGEEEVETPAGKFKALKIEVHGGTNDPLGGKGEQFSAFQWYAKDVGLVKEITNVEKGTSTTVLKEYKSESN